MHYYASWTNNRKTLKVFSENGFRVLHSPGDYRWADKMETKHGFKYCLDNGAWSAYQKGTELDLGLFLKVLKKTGKEAQFAVCPDICVPWTGQAEVDSRNRQKSWADG